MTVGQLADLIKKYNLEEQGYSLYYKSNYIGVYGAATRGMFINFCDCRLENVFNPIACDCKIKNMIKDFKEKAIKNKLNEIEKDFENGT
jgi:hypothetical protein